MMPSKLNSYRVLVAAPIPQEIYLWLTANVPVVHQWRGRQHPSDRELKDCDVLLVRSKTKIDSEFLGRASQLKVIVTATSGYDHIDLHASAARSITVMNCPDGASQSAAELTAALVLACCRKLPAALDMACLGVWDRQALLGGELGEKTYGIVGLGRVGTRVAKIFLGFGMHVIAFDPYCAPENFTRLGVERVGLQELLKLSDVISLHVPLTQKTRHLINRRTLDAVHPTTILVNTSRGEVVCESDLVEFLNQKKLGAVGLDVFTKEPLPKDSNLLSHPRIICTPHIGANTEAALSKVSWDAVRKVVNYLRRGETRDVVNKKSSENWGS